MVSDPDFAELKATVIKTVMARRITLGAFSAIALIVILLTKISYLNPLFYAPLVWFLLTFPFKYLIERQTNPTGLHWAHAGFFIAEIVLITALIHLMGGSEWIGVIFYVFTVIYANFFLPELQGYLITGLVVLLYSSLVILEYFGVIPHRSLFPPYEAPYRNLAYNLTTILAGAAGVYGALSYTVRAFTEIYARKNRALRARERELSKLSQRILSAQDEERRRIARVLHDELGQTLAAVKLELAAGGDVTRAQGLIDRAISQTRDLAHSLRPPLLDDLGLGPSLRRLGRMVEEAGNVDVRVRVEITERLPQEHEGLLFSAAQEALRNIEAHAQARHVEIAVEQREGAIVLVVTDDGIGFDHAAVPGLGLRGIRERVEGIGGRMSVSSRPGEGTRLEVEVPYAGDKNRDRR
ncbi:sensor histidine kinase [Candidatus Bipolaricaulota bacterium]|nr:sensor histidine kinase [Candidatus Bipolaricaulota bacterium]